MKKAVSWPLYGYDRARTRYLPAKGVKPPFRKLWRYTDLPLLEFPPVLAGGRLFLVNNSGFAVALDADTGRQLWKRRIGTLNASSPAYSRHRLYIVNLVPGHIVKLDAKTGKVIWKHPLPGRAESSPLVIGRSVYFGDEDGELYSLSTRNGNIRWATQLAGAVKSAPAYSGGTLYVGDYGGHMNAVDAKTGELKWQSGSLGPGLRRHRRLLLDPGRRLRPRLRRQQRLPRLQLRLSDGELAWSYSTGGYVYSGPAVASTGTPATVYVGSFDGNVYALNAKTGEPRWIQSAGRPVIGSLTAIGDIVYAAEFGGTSTTGFAMKTGRRSSATRAAPTRRSISDGRRLYLIGYSSITALRPSAQGGGRRRRGQGAARQAAYFSVGPTLFGPTPPGGGGGGGGGVGCPGAKAGKRFEWICFSRTARLAG